MWSIALSQSLHVRPFFLTSSLSLPGCLWGPSLLSAAHTRSPPRTSAAPSPSPSRSPIAPQPPVPISPVIAAQPQPFFKPCMPWHRLCAHPPLAQHLPAEPSPHPPSHPPRHHLGPASGTLTSPCCCCSSSSSGGFPPLAFHKALSVFACPSCRPPLSPVPRADVSPVVSSSAFLCLQHSQDSCLGIPLVFLNFLLSGQRKNSFGLLIPSFIDYFSSLWFYHGPSLRLALGPAKCWVCSRLMGTSSLPIAWRKLLHCLS